MQTYKGLSFPYFKDVYVIIDKVCREFGIEYYLIGAQARDFHLLENGIAPSRGTQDIDFAVMVPEIRHYNELKDLLIKYNFRKVNEPFRLIYDKTNAVIDLLPFGEIEEQGTVTFTERQIELSVIGMKEVSKHTLLVEMDDLTIRVSPLEGIVLLKLISFSNKPDRTKDLDDISQILKNYFDINVDRFYSEHLDISDDLENDDYIQLAGARLMGRDIKMILVQSDKLSNQIVAIIQNELAENPGSITQYFLSKNYFKDYELVKNIFAQLLKGIQDS